jgi:hypothetical protein
MEKANLKRSRRTKFHVILGRDFIPPLDLSYSVFGMRLRSNAALPGVAPIPSTASSPDIELHLGVSPYPEKEVSFDQQELTYTSSDCAETGEPVLRIWRVAKDAFLRIAYLDGTQFWLDRKRENLWATWPERLSLEETSTYLLGPILGLLLRLRGVTCLHASAVAIEDRCVAFAGREGAGKSTTAAAFARQGYGVLSDDIVALVEREDIFQAMPAYPHLSLWPDSVKMLYGSSETLPRFSPDWEKRRLALGEGGTRFESRSLPLGAIYLLGDRRPGPAPSVEAIRPQTALLSLVADSYANKVLDRELRACEFAVLGQLVSTVPVRRVHPHADPARLQELCRIIREDLAALDPPRPARP